MRRQTQYLRLAMAFILLHFTLPMSSQPDELVDRHSSTTGGRFDSKQSHVFTIQVPNSNANGIMHYTLHLFERKFNIVFKAVQYGNTTPYCGREHNGTCCLLGKSMNEDDSLIILNRCTRSMHGIIETLNVTYHIKPSGYGAGQHEVYRTIRDNTDIVTNDTCDTQDNQTDENVNETSVDYHYVKRRSLTPVPVIKVLVVVDQSMVKFHGNKTIRQYVLTIMGMVSQIYRDSSLGARVDLVVTNFIILNGDEKNLSISHKAHKTMSSFCHWQKDLDDMETRHNVALLITKLNICSDKDETCGTVGMAYISGICQSERRCSIVEDTGFDTASTIAHEIGHNLGISHDGTHNDCADKTRDIPHIMASTWIKPSKQGIMKWSKCSRRLFRKYIKSTRSWCLMRERSVKVLPFPMKLPGELFNADDQCKHQYGNLARQCERFKDRLCGELWCEIEGEYFCRTRMSPPAFGTACGDGKWCMYGNCVNSTSVLVKRDGGWSSWGDWGKCSTSCGSGVLTNRRKCNNPRPKNGGRYCAGRRERYRLCNQKECPKGSKDMRTAQCEAFNGRKYKNESHNWKPLLSKFKPCSLYCTPIMEERVSVQFSSKVIDGTPCRPGSKDLCVNGKCHKVGCDNVIGSDAKEDLCGVCRGNSTTCHTVEGSFYQPSGNGYVEVAVIPAGSRNIQVMETKPCTSFLALKGNLDTYYVNGNWKIQLPGQVDLKGTKVIYDRKGTWERLVVKGPTREPLHVMILYQGYNLGVTYKYSTPLPNKTQAIETSGSNKTKGKVNYGWVRHGWEQCSVVCGTGVQKSRKEECVRFVKGNYKVVKDIHCRRATKPKRERRVCNEHPCPIWWSTTRWSKCNSKCGAGRQNRLVLCMRKYQNGSITRTIDTDCTKDRPSSVQNCYVRTCRVKWSTTPWSKCFSICGKGYRFRHVRCPISGLCEPGAKPSARKRCHRGSCYKWKVADWGQCSRSCDYGYQRRQISCQHVLSKATGNLCNRLKKPPTIQLCRSEPCNNTTTT